MATRDIRSRSTSTHAGRPAARASGRTKHTISLDAETWRRLGRLAVDLDTDRSALLSAWARERLDRFERGGRDLSPTPGTRDQAGATELRVRDGAGEGAAA